MTVKIVSFEAEQTLNWLDLAATIEAGHTLPKAEIDDTFLRRGSDTLLSRSAWIDGLGVAVKSCTIFPGNTGIPPINGAVSLFSDTDGTLQAIFDFHLITKWKTAGDSLLGALKLARKDSRKILIVGAGTLANNLRQAYAAGFPGAEFTIWNRTQSNARALADKYPGMHVADDLETAVKAADIITCGTMSSEPVIKGGWLQPGQHLDLIGAYRADMREADDTALQRARLFVDSLATTVGHIGELKIPLQTGAIKESDIQAEYYDLSNGKFARRSDDEITLFKNGGGAHLDLMTCRYILDRVQTE